MAGKYSAVRQTQTKPDNVSFRTVMNSYLSGPNSMLEKRESEDHIQRTALDILILSFAVSTNYDAQIASYEASQLARRTIETKF